jgi:NAD(P)H-hydrate epimerase
LQFPKSLVLDADALNLLAENPHLLKKRENVVITPHPGEARRLAEAFGICETERLPLAAALAQKLQAVVLLKGKLPSSLLPAENRSLSLRVLPPLPLPEAEMF